VTPPLQLCALLAATALIAAGCGSGTSSGPADLDIDIEEAEPHDAEPGDLGAETEEPGEGEQSEQSNDSGATGQSEEDDAEAAGGGVLETDPLILSGRFGVAFIDPPVEQARAGDLAVRAGLSVGPTLSGVFIEVDNEGTETQHEVVVRVDVDYSATLTPATAAPDPNETAPLDLDRSAASDLDESAAADLDQSAASDLNDSPNVTDLVPVPPQRPDEVVAAMNASTGSCSLGQGATTIAVVTCELGGLAAGGSASISIEFRPNLTGDVGLVINATART
jgi:hypothetical protein